MIKFERLPADILSKIPDVKRILLQDHNVIFAYLFGGLSEGKVKPLSDIDISVYVRDTGNLAEYKISLFDRLTDSLSTNELVNGQGSWGQFFIIDNQLSKCYKSS